MYNLSLNKSVDKKKAKEINLKELLLVIRRRYWILVVVMLLTSIGIYQSISTKILLFQSSSRIIIGADEESRKTLQVIIKDPTILDKVVKKLDIKESAEALAGQINVTNIEGSQVVSISVVDKDPIMAAKIADTTADVFKDEVPKIVGQNYVRLLSNAKVNPIPINQNQNNKIIFYITIGIVIGLGLIFLLDSLDDTVRSVTEIETLLGVPVLGKVSKIKRKNVKRNNIVQLDLDL